MSSFSELTTSNIAPEMQTKAQMNNIRPDTVYNKQELISSIEDTSFPDMTVQPGDIDMAMKNLTRGILAAPPLGLKAQTALLSKLADEVEDIMPCFNDILDQEYLKRCDVTLNRAPIIGIKGNDIFYINTVSTCMSNVVSKWTLFGPKPGDVIIAGDQANHFFPYQGDLCLAVGKSVWRKRHRSEGDPLINKAVNHWPSLYEDSWENMGNRCLPDANLLSVISYAALSMDCTDILSHLIILTRDGTIMVSNNDRLVDGASFRKMSNTSNETVTWKKITYWNDKVVGLDSNNCTWSLTINFVEHTYKADDKLQVRAFSEFTATDMGLVGLGENGILYRRIVNRNPGKEDANKSICTWESWMPHYGVTSIGVASPGARLDLHTLARILKSRYVETALALYPFFQKFSIFGVIHSVYIEGSLREVAKEYNKAYQNEKDEVAIKAGKKIGPHMKTLCKILARQAAMCHDTVAKILRDIDDIRPDLQYQRITIIDQVKSAEGFVKNLNSDYNKIDAWLWGPIETSVAGPEHALLKISSDLLVSTLDTLKRLEYFTKILHEFWNGMLTNVMMLQDMSLAAAKRLGEGILKSDSIEASNAATKSFIRRTQNLLAILNRDGIRLPIDDANSLMMHSSNRQR